MKLFNIFRRWLRHFSPYQPLIEVVVSRSALLHNLHAYHQAYPHLALAPVLKSNAYGHGLLEVAEILKEQNIAFLALDSLAEARLVRHHGIKTKIVIIGYTTPENIIICNLPQLSFVITDLAQLQSLSHQLSKPLAIHLKIDTGMHRQGILPSQIPEAITLIKANTYLQLEGICSHLADADNVDESFSQGQLIVWKQATQELEEAFSPIPYIHLAASAGTRFSSAEFGNTVRLGLGLYGIDTSPDSSLLLKPALELHTQITSLKEVVPGDSVGYNHTHTFSQPATIATVPVGYFEGVDRRLSNQGYMMVKGRDCPIVGRVSMNITSIDVSGIPDIQVGERVTVISAQPGAKNSVQEMAKQCQTIPWEIMVHMPSQLRRVVID